MKNVSLHLRLPTEIFTRIDTKAKAEGRFMYRVIIDELRSIPELESGPSPQELLKRLEIVRDRLKEILQ